MFRIKELLFLIMVPLSLIKEVLFQITVISIILLVVIFIFWWCSLLPLVCAMCVRRIPWDAPQTS